MRTALSTIALHSLLEHCREGLCIVDARWRCLYINQAGARMLGSSPDELIGTPMQATMHPHLGATVSASTSCLMCRSVETHTSERDIDAVFWRKDGRAAPVSYSITPFHDDKDAGAAIAFTDSSEHDRLTGELRERMSELEMVERQKTEFIATLAHELRNPLAPIRAALQAMRKTTDDVTSMAHLREMMERHLTQLVIISNDLLDIARLTSGQMQLQKRRLALQEIVVSATEACAPFLATSNNTLTSHVPATPLYFDGDSTRLVQVITNLLKNASQNSDAGSPISLDLEVVESTIVIDIADAGVGIAREALARIFDLFSRVGREERRSRDGLGVGLNLSKRLIEMHGGSLAATSEGPGKGSHFIIKLPLNESLQTQAISDNETPTKAAALTPVRALIVDDNVDAAATLSLLLELGGHTTRTASDGPEALRMAADYKPDVVLLDIGMPGMDGYEVARELRNTPSLGPLLLIAVTGWGGPEDRQRSIDAGFDEHLTKPVDFSMIELLLARTLPRQNAGGGLTPPIASGETPI